MEPDSSDGDAGSSSSSESLIFVSDASAEAERLAAGLRTRGYVVVDVPLALLLSRVAAQKPAIVLCDADAADAFDTIERLREMPGGQSVDVLFFGDPSRALHQDPERVARQSSGSFTRPVDTQALLRKVEGLIGPPRAAVLRPPLVHGSRVPVLVAATRRPYRYDKNARRPNLTAPRYLSAGVRVGQNAPAEGAVFPSTLPTDVGGSADQGNLDSISPDVRALLGEADRRVIESRGFQLGGERLSPEAELEAVLPSNLLAALDEPLDEEDDDDQVGTPGTHGSDASRGDPESRGDSERRSVQDSAGTAPGGASHPLEAREPITAAQDRTSGVDSSSRQSRTANAPSAPARSEPFEGELPDLGRSIPAKSLTDLAVAAEPSVEPRNTYEPASPKPVSTTPPRGGSGPEAPLAASKAGPPESADVEIPNTLRAGDAVRVLARAVRARYTGAIAFEDEAGIRRVVLRDGDFVIAATGIEGEALTAFLSKRGDLPADVAARLGRKLPQFGRHAGAALIAHGSLRQEDLWPVLRAHAEWLITHVAKLERAMAGLERIVPPRLSSEPSVFGGATGAEVLIEVARRALPPNDALLWLGGPQTILARAEAEGLLAECALGEDELELVRSASGASIAELLERSGSQELPTLLFTLVELGVLRAHSSGRKPQASKGRGPPDAMDHEAIRARISARRALVDEGDYFALLGVSRNATSYDIRRAYSRLRQEFEPSRILTLLTADLTEDVAVIADVLDEAYEILRDSVRRHRYLRALEETPGVEVNGG